MAATRRMTGRVKSINRQKGYGFIVATDRQELFFHRSDLIGLTWDALEEGTPVSFVMKDAPKGPRAEQVSYDEEG